MQKPDQIKENALQHNNKETSGIQVSNLDLLPAATIAVYEGLVTGAAKDLLEEEVEWQKHRRRLEMMEAENRRKSLYFSMMITLLFLAAAVAASIYAGTYIGIGVFFGPVLLGLISRFLNPSAERNSPARLLSQTISKRIGRGEQN